MYSLHWSARRGGKVVHIAAATLPCVAFILFVGAMGVGDVVGQVVQRPQIFGGRVDQPQRADQDSVAGVYLPTDRALSRAIVRARERIGEQEYHESLAFLHGILGRNEDSFIERSADDREQLGLKATARKMIGDLPAAGIDAYELLQGPTARRQLEAALKEGDRDNVAKVVRQFFHTTAGYEATLVLAQMEADQGHRLAAAQLFQDLIDTPRAAARFDPQLSIAAALNQLAAGRPDDAAGTIRALVERKPTAEISINGKKVSMPAAGADPLAWLMNVAGTMKALSPAALNWLTMHGDPSRNVESPGGQPHLRPRWEARVVNEPTIESYLTSRMNDFLQRGVVAIPGARPIAVGDVVIMRTPDNVVAVDWETGKRVWETRDEQELETEEAPADLAPGIDHDQLIAQGKPLEERMWDDALATAISSDGARVFVVRGLPVSRDEDSFPWQINPGFGRGGVETAAATNQLAAYDIATEGKLAWELDGARTTGPLAGAFFLGPPLAIDNTLFVMAEIRSAVYLVALDPATGRVEWQQQLVGLEQGILLDPARRRVGASPSYAGGILVCPTGASAAVAIDVVKREFAWVYRYAREAQTANETRQIWQQQQMQAQLVRANDQWLDSSAIIADNRVLITPPESAEIHCINLHTGKVEWKPRRQGDALFIGGVDRGVVLLVGSQSVQGLRLADGAAAWKQESVSLPAGVLPAGQGYLSEGHYFLPLTSGQIAEIEVATGKIDYAEPASPDVVLGNLICYRGSIVSQSPLLLDKFEQLELLQKRTEAALAKNPDDTNALRELAEINGAAGKKDEAVRMLKRAHDLAPEDPVTQEMLVELLLQQLASDYAANRADVPLVAKLIHSRDQQIELLRIDATGLDALDQKGAAWDAYLLLADFTAEEPAYLRIDDRYNVRSDRWIASRLGAIWSQASVDDRKSLEDKIAARRPSLKKSLTAAEMRHYLAHIGELPGADDVRLALASFLVDRGRAQEAEIELLQLVNAKSSEDASRVAIELLAKLDAKANERNAPRHVKWPLGKVESKIVTTVVPNNNERMARAPIERQNGYRKLRVEQDYWPAGSNLQWFVAMDSSELVGRNSLGEDVYHLAIDTTMLPRNHRANPGLIHGASLGHLLFITVGGQVMAIDSRQDAPDAEGDLLWPSRALEELSAEAGRTRRGLPPAPTRTNRPPVYNSLSGRQRVNGAAGSASGSLGPVTPRGVVFQDAEELKCVDPLSGLLLWARTDVPAGCELFGDDEFVFAADVGKHEAYVVRLSDGALVGKREVARSEWLLTTGRNLAQLDSSSKQITVTDIWSQKSVYQGKIPANMRLSVIEPNAIAVFDPTGKFQVLDVASGKMLIDTKLEPISDLQSIVTMRSGDDLFLFASSQVQQQTFKSIGQPAEFPLINGQVYAFSLKTGDALWPSPALVRNRGVVLQQPRDIPFLVFADRQMQRDASNGSSSQLRVLCLDRRTGQTVYRNDAIPETAVVRFRVRGEADSRPAVAVELGTSKIQLTMTDTPRPPQPPGNDDLEAPREIVERGLPAIGQRMWGAFRGAMDKPVPGAVPRQPQQVLPQQPNPKLQQQPQQPAKPAEAPPAEKPDPDFDDD